MKTLLNSKTFWTNLIALGVMVYQSVTGNTAPIPLEIQAGILSIINIVLRTITKEPIVWK